ncbi:hypothetical protein [Metamycoplasma equirhinis]|uniref:Uncharacterized protein n=1 Tax=Metamycoplasma equirhinis TaxID=92402 RepID=A0ABZ0PAK0_9BACT|nr:hypothetical protein [Metamycoplasma equirhinis]TPD98829.1 hypothetical protein FJM08_01140 [Metamycoplasma equirhinis]WPB53994.1 hypothetical protein R9B83_00230 [Metamycoplasma equirhinis]
MLIKYKLISNIHSTDEQTSYETNFVSYSERQEEKFIIISFIDEKKFACELKISADEIYLSYSVQKIYLKRNKFTHNEMIFENNMKFLVDAFLKNVSIGAKEISFEYDLLQGTQIIVSNKIILEIQKETK